MVRAQTFSGLETEDPDLHLQVFEELCSCLIIPGMSQETLRWKLFPFSLVGKAKQWYTHNMRGTIHDWEELRDDFCLSFSSASHTTSLRSEILAFEQVEKETVGAAWARFSRLLASSPDWSIPDDVALHIFYTGLDMDSADDLDIAAEGSFTHRSPIEGREILDRILRKSSLPSYPGEPQHESKLHHESPSSAESSPSPPTSLDSSVEPSPEPRASKEEEIQPSKLSSQLEDYLYEILTNTSSYLCDGRPTASLSSPRKSMNKEWLEGMKCSSEAFRIAHPPRPFLVQ